MEQVDGERQSNIEKIETILDEQTELREKDQAIFHQVCKARDYLQSEIETKDIELTSKNQQITGMAQST